MCNTWIGVERDQLSERSVTMKLIEDLRIAAEDAESPSSRLLSSAADQIEWYCIILQEIADRNRCSCEQKHIDRKVSAPKCPAHLAGDDAREALGLDVECLGRLARRKPLTSHH